MSDTLKKTSVTLETLFKVTYLLLTLVSFNFYFIERPILTYFSYVVTAFAVVITILRAIHFKDYINKYTIILAVFTVSYIISCIYTIQYGYLENIKALIWMFVQYFLVFARNKNDTPTSIKQEAKVLAYAFLIYTFIFGVVSIVMLFMDYSFMDKVNGVYVRGGFLWNRLWGAYADPNYGSVLALESVAICILFFSSIFEKTLKPKLQKVFNVLLWVNIVIQYLYVAFSDSRTGQVAASGMVFVGLLIYLYNKKPDVKVIKKATLSFVIAFVCAVALFASFKGITSATSAIKVKITENQLGVSKEDQNLTYEQQLALEKAELGRDTEEINEGDISNNRFSIWKNSVDIFKTSPIVGISFRNVGPYVEANQIQGIFLKGGFVSAHNFVFDVLMSQGLLGIVILAGLVIVMFITYFKGLCNKSISKELMLILTLLILPCAVGGLFVSDLFYLNTGSAFVFWYVLGITMNIIDNKTKEIRE